MNAFSKFFSKGNDEGMMLAGGDGMEAQTKPKRDKSEYFYFFSVVFLMVMISFSYYSTADLFYDWELAFKGYHEAVKATDSEKKNIEALAGLKEELDNIKSEKVLIDQAIAKEPRYDQIVKYLEQQVRSLARKYDVVLPNDIGWKEVSPDDVSNTDMQDLQIFEYPFSYKGDYQGMLKFIKEIRENLRLMDIVEVNGLRLDDEGLVNADLVAWAYNLPTN